MPLPFPHSSPSRPDISPSLTPPNKSSDTIIPLFTLFIPLFTIFNLFLYPIHLFLSHPTFSKLPFSYHKTNSNGNVFILLISFLRLFIFSLWSLCSFLMLLLLSIIYQSLSLAISSSFCFFANACLLSLLIRIIRYILRVTILHNHSLLSHSFQKVTIIYLYHSSEEQTIYYFKNRKNNLFQFTMFNFVHFANIANFKLYETERDSNLGYGYQCRPLNHYSNMRILAQKDTNPYYLHFAS